MNRAQKRKKRIKSKFSIDQIGDQKLLGVIFLIAIIYRISMLQYRFAVVFDEVNYLKLGVSGFLNNSQSILHTYWAPLYPFIVSLFCRFTDDYELAGRLVSVLFGAVLIYPVYYLARKQCNKSVSLIAALFIAIFPPLAFNGTSALPEPLYIFLVTVILMLGWSGLKDYSIFQILFSGLLIGLLYLTKPEGIGFIIVLSFWIIWGSLSKMFLIKPLRGIYMIFALFLGFSAAALPYILYLHQSTGVWTISTKGMANLKMDTPVNGEIPEFRALDEANKTLPIDEVFHIGNFEKSETGRSTKVAPLDIMNIVKKYVKNLYHLLHTQIPGFITTLPMLFLGIGILGLALTIGNGRFTLYLLSFIAAYWFVLVPLYHFNERYFITLIPIISICVANGIYITYQALVSYFPLIRFLKRKKIKIEVGAGLILISIIVIFSFFIESIKIYAKNPNNIDYWADSIEQKEAGIWLKENGKESPIIMSRGHTADFYAGNYSIAESVSIPKNSRDRVLAYAKHRAVDYLVLNERYIQEYPFLKGLLFETETLPDLSPVYRSNSPAGLRTVVYKFIK